VQVVAVTLLPSLLVFMMLMLNDRDTMGDHVNTTWQNVVNGGIVLVVIVMSTMLGLQTLYPQLFR